MLPYKDDEHQKFIHLVCKDFSSVMIFSLFFVDSDSEVTKDEQERRLKHISNVRKRTVGFYSNFKIIHLSK